MPRGNWMYGDEKEKSMLNVRIRDKSVLEYTKENTIGDPYVSKPRLVRTPWSTTKAIFKWYFIVCGIVVNLIQLIMWMR